MNTHKLLPTEAAFNRLRTTPVAPTMSGLLTTGIVEGMAIAAAACNTTLDVQNPGAIQEGQLGDPALVQLIVNGAIGEFQYAYGQYAQWSAVLSDEAFTDHTNVDVRQFSLHDFTDLNTVNSGVYEYLQRARQSADDAADRLKVMLGTGASSSLDVARVL